MGDVPLQTEHYEFIYDAIENSTSYHQFKWQKISERLNIPYMIIYTITLETVSTSKNLKELYYRTFDYWRQVQGKNATLGRFIEVLEAEDLQFAAQQIREKYSIYGKKKKITNSVLNTSLNSCTNTVSSVEYRPSVQTANSDSTSDDETCKKDLLHSPNTHQQSHFEDSSMRHSSHDVDGTFNKDDLQELSRCFEPPEPGGCSPLTSDDENDCYTNGAAANLENTNKEYKYLATAFNTSFEVSSKPQDPPEPGGTSPLSFESEDDCVTSERPKRRKLKRLRKNSKKRRHDCSTVTNNVGNLSSSQPHERLCTPTNLSLDENSYDYQLKIHEKHLQYIIENLDLLVSSMHLDEALLANLRSDELLSSSECYQLNVIPETEAKMKLLFTEILPRKPGFFKKLIKCLELGNQADVAQVLLKFNIQPYME